VIFLSALVRRSFARVGWLFAGVAVLLMGLQALLVTIAVAQEEVQSFELITRLAPSFLQRQFGSALPMFLSFSGLVTFGYFHPVVLLTLAVGTAVVATELAGDIEGGQVDLLLSRPVARHWLVTRSLLMVLLVPLLLVLLMLMATWISLAGYAPNGARWPSAAVLASMAAHLVALAWCVGALGLATAAAVSRRMSAMGPVAIAAVSLYLLDLVATAWRPLAPVAIVSPFHYYQGAAILAGTADLLGDLLVLGSMAAVAFAFAYWRFSTRDV
jgi:ABC-type transport system involved in multi-copper enzyme maturation permease subunit